MPDRSVPPPIPDEAYAAAQRRTGELIDYWELSPAGYKLDEDDPADVETPVDVVVGEIVDAAAPAILEDRVEAVMYELARHAGHRREELDAPEWRSLKASYERRARRVLGLPVEGEDPWEQFTERKEGEDG